MNLLTHGRVVFEKAFLISFFILFTLVQFGFTYESIGIAGDVLLVPGQALIEVLFSFTTSQVGTLYYILFLNSFIYGVAAAMLWYTVRWYTRRKEQRA